MNENTSEETIAWNQFPPEDPQLGIFINTRHDISCNIDSFITPTQYITFITITDHDNSSDVLATVRIMAFKDSNDVEIRAIQKSGDIVYYQITNINNTVLVRQTVVDGLTWSLQTTYPINNNFPVFGNCPNTTHPCLKINTPTTTKILEDVDQVASRYSYERYQFAYG